MANPTLPYIISGRVLDDDNSTARANITLTMTNKRTGETTTATTGSDGSFALDAANFENGYEDGDRMIISSAQSGTNGNDLRIRIDCLNGYGKVNELHVSYSIRS